MKKKGLNVLYQGKRLKKKYQLSILSTRKSWYEAAVHDRRIFLYFLFDADLRTLRWTYIRVNSAEGSAPGTQEIHNRNQLIILRHRMNIFRRQLPNTFL